MKRLPDKLAVVTVMMVLAAADTNFCSIYVIFVQKMAFHPFYKNMTIRHFFLFFQ
jgi:hypothetical protein